MRGNHGRNGATLARVLVVLALYAALVAYRWWPLVLHLDDQLPYIPPVLEFDRLYSMWVLAWSSHALSTAPARLADANIYFPARDALFYGPTGFGALPLFAPVYLLSGNPIRAINITFLAGVAATAWTPPRVGSHGSAVAGGGAPVADGRRERGRRPSGGT